MSEQLVLSASRREVCGGGRANRLRKTGVVPGVIYSDGAPAEMIQVNTHDFGLILQHHGESMILSLAIDEGEHIPVMIKEIQHHPVSDSLVHVDFMKISMTENLQTHIPIHLKGESAGVKLGGILDQSLFDLDVEGLPGDIPESIDVDVSELNVGDQLTVADIKMPQGLSAISDATLTVVSVLAPRIEEEDTSEESEKESEPEVISGQQESKSEE